MGLRMRGGMLVGPTICRHMFEQRANESFFLFFSAVFIRNTMIWRSRERNERYASQFPFLQFEQPKIEVEKIKIANEATTEMEDLVSENWSGSYIEHLKRMER